MVLLEKLWDDVVSGPHSQRGHEKKLKQLQTQNLLTNPIDGDAAKCQRSLSMPGATVASPGTPTSPVTPTTPSSARSNDNVWRSVFHPGSNLNTRTIGNQIFDNPSHSSSPTVYDWLYSKETRSKHV
ncbi:hypothetical protein SOVF_194210 [Spinacia oleracea]|uniref:Auxin-repressed 12.5 kDa protein n=1 Tax=Spinacia oleracea TaxID=3562 RepID=A0A9R0JGV4_SPIOL|nr:auxin-repressed 12.5 kDa protein [Spinacia oleracea]KNA05025.1 hypothetical protein SOVF_194210 [Spinacia oleracea]